MYNTIRSSRIYEQIVAQIQKLIVDGQLSSGDRLPSERELAEQLGVSRTAVREAIKALVERGIVEIRPGRGSYIADFAHSTSEIVLDSLRFFVEAGLSNGSDDLIQVRQLLEPDIAALAAENATRENIAALQRVVETMDSALDDPDEFVEADLRFHLLLGEATQNSVIPLLLSPIVSLLREQRELIFQTAGGPERGQFHHKKILAAIVSKNPVRAREAMFAHIQQVTEDSQPAN